LALEQRVNAAMQTCNKRVVSRYKSGSTEVFGGRDPVRLAPNPDDSSAIVVSGKPYPYELHSVTVLLVYAPGPSILYEVWGIGKSSDFDWIDHEMQSIIASFHVEKVAAPPGRKP
jgi:hypothetical protein